MEFVKHNPALAGNILGSVPTAPEPEVPFFETLEAGFRQDNDVAAALSVLARPTIPPEPNFDPVKYGEEKYGEFWLDNFKTLGGAKSSGEMDALAARIRQEESDRELLASQGWSGFVAGMAAGIFSPVMFIPLMGPSRGLRGVAEATALAFGASTVQEATLFATQLKRTPEQSAFNIAAGTVLGGLLGGSAAMLRKADFDDLAAGMSGKRMATGETPPAIPETEVRAVLQVGDDMSIRRVPTEGHGDVPLQVDESIHPAALLRHAERLRVVQTKFDEVTAKIGENEEALIPAIRQMLNDAPSDPAVKDLNFMLDEATRRVEARGPVLATEDGGEVASRTPVLEELRNVGREIKEGTLKLPEVEREKLPEVSPPSEGSRSVGAALRGEQRAHSKFDPATAPTSAGKMAPAGAVGRGIAHLSPVLRAINQDVSPALRRLMSRLSDAGVDFENNPYGLAAAPGGTAESRQGFYTARAQRIIESLEDSYIKYVLGGPGSFVERQRIKVYKFLNKSPTGKISFKEFNDSVTDTVNLRAVHEIPEVNEVVKIINKQYKIVKDIADQVAEDLGLPKLFGGLDITGDGGYINHIFSPAIVAARKGDFIRDVADWINKSTVEEFNEAYRKILEKNARDKDVSEMLRMGEEEAGKLYDELKAQLDSLAHPADANPVLDQAAGLRRQARALAEAEFERMEARNTEKDPEITKLNRAAANKLTKERAGELRAEAKRLVDNLPEEVKQTLTQRTAVRNQMRKLNDSIGRRTTRSEDLLERISRSEEENIGTLQRLARAGVRFEKGMAKFSEETYEKELAKLTKQFDETAERVAKSEEKLAELYEELGTEFEPTEKISIEEARHVLLQERLESIMKRIPEGDRAAQRAAVQAKMRQNLEFTNQVIRRRNARQDALRERLKKADPRIAKNEADRLIRKNRERLDEFLEKERLRGIEQEFTEEGLPQKFNFSGKAKEIATKIANGVTGSSGRMYQLDVLAGEHGSELSRYLNIPYTVKEQYLEKDIQKLARVYMRSMGPDIELYRATGAVNGDGPWGIQAVRDQFDRYSEYLQTRERDKPDKILEDGTRVPQGKEITPARREKDLAEFETFSKEQMANLRGVIDRLRHRRGLPEDPDSIPWRLGRAFMNWNVSTMMGTALVTSLPDASRPVMAYGLNNTFRDGWQNYVKGMIKATGDFTASDAMKRELKLLGIGVDTWMGSRAHAMMDIYYTYGKTTKAERFLEWTAQSMPQWAGFGQWTDAMKQITGFATMARTLRAVQDLNLGRADDETIRWMASVGLDEDHARRIWNQLQTPNGGTKYKDWRQIRDPNGSTEFDDIIIPNSESWTDLGAVQALSAVMHRESDRIIVTPGVEKPLFADASIGGRMVYQFRSFTFSSTQKMLLSGLQQRDMALFNVVQGTMISLALGTLSYYIWGRVSGGRAEQEMLDADWRTWTDQAIYRSGILGVFSEAQTIGSEIPAIAPFVTLSGSRVAGRQANNLVEAIVGPSLSKAFTIAGVVQGLDDPTQGTARQMKQLVPGQNIVAVRRGFDSVTQAAAEAAGLPEKRQ